MAAGLETKADLHAEIERLKRVLAAQAQADRFEQPRLEAEAQHARWAARQLVRHMRELITGAVQPHGFKHCTVIPQWPQAEVDRLLDEDNLEFWALSTIRSLNVAPAYRRYAITEARRLWRAQ